MNPLTSSAAWARLLPLVLVVAAPTWLATPASSAPDRTSFANPTPLYVGDPVGALASTTSGVTIPTWGPATPYPAAIPATRAGTIKNVSVVLEGLTHPRPEDLEVLLVGPGGQQALLMANAGGDTPVSGIDIGFVDHSTPLPDAGPLQGIDYQPQGFGTVTEFPEPAPALDGNSALSVFDGTNAAGEWRVYVFDVFSGEGGSLDDVDLRFELDTMPYPSTVNVSDLAGRVTDVDVSLHDIGAGWPDDLDLLLVGPQEQQATILSDAGGGGDNSFAGVDLVLDDEAGALLPDEDVLVTGTYRPANHGEPDAFPAPAPVPDGAAALAAFDGTNPNGQWHLYAADDGSTGLHEILGGWTLHLETSDSQAPTGSVSVVGGDATLGSPAVTLALSATDPSPGTGVTQVRLSNSGPGGFGAWQPYAATVAWTLAAGPDGPRTVHAQFVDAVGNLSPVVSDTVTIDTTAPTLVRIKPAHKADHVSPKTKIKIVVGEPLDAATVTKRTVLLKRGTTKVKATVILKRGTTIVLAPKKPLTDGKHKVTVASTVTDLVGHALDAKPKPGTQTLRWTFRV